MYDFDEERFGEEALIRKAVGIAVNRLQDRRVWQNTYDVATRYNTEGDVMENSNLTNTEKDRWNLLWHQLHWLSQPNGDDDTDPPFPNIRIHAGHEERDNKGRGWLGRAHTNLVTIRSIDRGVRQKGEFDIQINRYYLAGGGHYSDPEEWASTIAHEMLHNLGHLHEGGSSDAYQINALNNAVLCNGYYKNPRYRWRSSNHV